MLVITSVAVLLVGLDRFSVVSFLICSFCPYVAAMQAESVPEPAIKLFNQYFVSCGYCGQNQEWFSYHTKAAYCATCTELFDTINSQETKEHLNLSKCTDNSPERPAVRCLSCYQNIKKGDHNHCLAVGEKLTVICAVCRLPQLLGVYKVNGVQKR